MTKEDFLLVLIVWLFFGPEERVSLVLYTAYHFVVSLLLHKREAATTAYVLRFLFGLIGCVCFVFLQLLFLMCGFVWGALEAMRLYLL